MTRRPGSHLPATEKTRAALAALGLTVRQLEYWIDRGWIVADGRPAQGRPREFSASERRVLAVMARLTRAGFPAATAARVARKAVSAAGQDSQVTVVLDADSSLLLVLRGI
jgi:DNA-binding transcriptional MerR regulator